MWERELLLHIDTFVLTSNCYSTPTLKTQSPGMMPYAHIVTQPKHVSFAQKLSYQVLP